MEKLLILLVAISLSACEKSSGSLKDLETNHGYGYAYNFRTPLGVFYRNDTASPPAESADIDQSLKNAAACLGVEASADVYLISVDDTKKGYEGTFQDNPPIILDVPNQYKALTLLMYEHEFVHYLLWKTYGDMDINHTNGCYPPITLHN